MIPRARRPSLGRATLLLLAALAAAGFASRTSAASEIDQVSLDVPSGVIAERLPFDVPFVVFGQAPAGTVRVEATYAVAKGGQEPYGAESPGSPLLAGVDGEGRFRVQVAVLPPGRRVRFRLTFERRLRSPERFTDGLEDLLRALVLTADPELTAERAASLRADLLARFDLALNEARAEAFPRGASVRRAPSPIFDDEASADAARRALAALARDALAAAASRAEAVERYVGVSKTFEGDLAAASASPALLALLTALERRPETDPRNPMQPLALSRAARRLIGLEGAARASVAAGRGPAEAPIGLETTERSDDAEAFAERYRATASALQELREWLSDLVLATGAHHGAVQRLVQSGELDGDTLHTLQALAGTTTGQLRRAERWAEALQAHARDVGRALRAGEQATKAMASALAAQALAVTVRQTTLTEPASTDAGIYVGLDLGVLYPPELDRASLYLGANLYFRPINKRASLRSQGSLAHRFSLTFGISLNNLKLEEGDPRFEALLGDDSNLLVGAGLRLSRSLRLSSGAVLFLKNDPNPLVTDRSLAATFYVAVSLDVDIVRAFRSLGE